MMVEFTRLASLIVVSVLANSARAWFRVGCTGPLVQGNRTLLDKF